MNRGLGGALFHLDFTRAALGCPELNARVAHSANQPPPRAEARTIILTLQAKCAGHATAPPLKPAHLDAANQTQQILTGRADIQCPQMARQVVAKCQVEWLKIQFELAGFMQLPEIVAGFVSMGRD